MPGTALSTHNQPMNGTMITPTERESWDLNRVSYYDVALSNIKFTVMVFLFSIIGTSI